MLIYCIGLFALAALCAFLEPRPTWLELTNTFALLLFAPLLLLPPVALLVRSRWMTGVLVRVLALFVTLFGAHFMPRAVSPTGPLIVIGDFNTGDREPRYAQLAARMHDAFRETNRGFGFTFPDHKRMGPVTFTFPLVRIDYIWSKGGALPAAAHVECNNIGADHCFLIADLRLGTAEALRH
jgi:hypothetical protein